MSLILTETKDAIGTIVMNHAQKRNALSEALIDEITVALKSFQDKNIRAAVLRAPAGAKVWSAGHDISELPDRGRDPLGWSDPLRVLVRAIQEFPAPIIALIEGGVWGGGCEVAMACDILVATPDATFAITPAKLGVPYNLGGILTLMNMIPLPVAKEMLFTAQPIPTSQALNLGVINYIKSAEEIESFVY
ncbi:MAG: methylmalonyl-CoA decarboxylase, partial [Candidatus Competibacter sp.]